MPQYIEGGFMVFSKIHNPHWNISDQISWLHSNKGWFHYQNNSIKSVNMNEAILSLQGSVSYQDSLEYKYVVIWFVYLSDF